VSTSCDVAIESLEALLDAVLSAGRVSALTGTGVSMSANANVTEYLLWVLHIVTDSYDAPGGMWFNPGYLLRLDQRDLPVSDGTPEPGPKSRPDLPRRFGEYPCSALVPEIEAGNITTLIVVGGNPVTALPDRDRTLAALSSLSTLVVIDVLPTETTDLATHVLPAVDQLERADLTWLLDSFQLAVAAQFTEAVVQPLHERRPVWWMFAQLANRLGLDLLPRDIELNDQTETQLLMKVVDRSIDPQSLMSTPSLTISSGAIYGWVTANVLPSGMWRLEASALQTNIAERLENPPQHVPSVLLPSRRLKLMNSQFREIAPPGGTLEQPAIYASPSAVAALGNPQLASVATAFGTITAKLLADETLRDDSVVLSHGWGDANVCALTSAATGIDSLTGMVLQSGLEVELRAAD
jgi:anaerobic selenocysteine-containing dehydrogenase